MPPLTAETRFPLGTFRVWTVWRPAAQVLVYPAPEAFPPPLPPGEPRAGGASATRVNTTGEFDGVRAYRRGDPAQAGRLEEGGQERRAGQPRHAAGPALRTVAGLAQAGHLDVERKLSRLAAWVLQADRLGLDYGLRLPGQEIKPATGEAHKRRCLEALAVC